MTAKKNTIAPTTAHRSKKDHQPKARKSEAVSTESVPAGTTEETPQPTVEESQQNHMEEAPQCEDASLPTAAMARLSALDAALRVLAESGQAMNCQELIAAMAAEGYWSSPKGRTPAATLYACFLREMKSKGEKARIVKTTRGKFALRPSR